MKTYDDLKEHNLSEHKEGIKVQDLLEENDQLKKKVKQLVDEFEKKDDSHNVEKVALREESKAMMEDLKKQNTTRKIKPR